MYCDYFDCPLMHLFRQEFPDRPPFGGPGGGPGGPPFGGPGGSPFGGPGGPGAGLGPPSSPPPSFAPQQSQAQTYSQGFGATPLAVSPGSLRPCLYRFVYIWPRRGRGFWAWLTRVDRRSASGWRWNGRRWVYFGIDLRQIESFQCY